MGSDVTDKLIIKNKKNLKGYKKVGLTKLHKSINDFNSFGFKGPGTASFIYELFYGVFDFL